MNGKCEVVFVDRFHRLDWEIQLGRVKAATDRYRYRPLLFVDSTGVGEPILESLRRGGVSAQPYPFTQRSKAALIDNLAIAFEKRKIILPKLTLAPELIDELEAFEYSVSETGNVKTGAPGGMHDDCVIALALSAWIPGKRSPEPTNPLDTRDALLRMLGQGVPRRENPLLGW